MAKAKTKKLPLLNQNGENIGEVKVQTSVFAIEPNTQAIFDAVLVARTNSRQDTSKTKKRDEVSGGGKKAWRQKVQVVLDKVLQELHNGDTVVSYLVQQVYKTTKLK